jgi:hypothetical protein
MDAEMTKLLVTKAYPRSNGICKTWERELKVDIIGAEDIVQW